MDGNQNLPQSESLRKFNYQSALGAHNGPYDEQDVETLERETADVIRCTTAKTTGNEQQLHGLTPMIAGHGNPRLMNVQTKPHTAGMNKRAGAGKRRRILHAMQ